MSQHCFIVTRITLANCPDPTDNATGLVDPVHRSLATQVHRWCTTHMMHHIALADQIQNSDCE